MVFYIKQTEIHWTKSRKDWKVMGKYSGINRPYEIKGEDKSPAERQRELDEKMKAFLAKGGQVKKEKPMKPTKQQLESWKI